MKKILFICHYFFPGSMAGGPQQTISNVINILGNEADFFVLAANHDLNCSEEYVIETDVWLPFDKGHVMYLSDSDFTGKKIVEVSRNMDIVYCCGLFENTSLKAILEHKKKKINSQFYIAPMGVFFDGAMSQKKIKKRVFIAISKCLRLFEDVRWSFTSVAEKKSASKYIKINNYVIAEDLPRPKPIVCRSQRKQEKQLKVVFISRICEQKNLLYCFDVLRACNKDIEIFFDIYGPKENMNYWKKCEKEIELLPSNIKCKYCGPVESSCIPNVFSLYDVFLFPTRSENYGHIIYEALSVGCVPIISDQTPWTDLEKEKCGAVVNLKNPTDFTKWISLFAKMNECEFNYFSQNSIGYATKKLSYSISNTGYRTILN